MDPVELERARKDILAEIRREPSQQLTRAELQVAREITAVHFRTLCHLINTGQRKLALEMAQLLGQTFDEHLAGMLPETRSEQ